MSPQPNFKSSRQMDPVSDPCYITTLPPQNQDASKIVTTASLAVAPRNEIPKLPPRNTTKITPAVPPRYLPPFVPEVPVKRNIRETPKNIGKPNKQILPDSPRRNSVHFHPDIVTPSLKGILKGHGSPNFDDSDHLYEDCQFLKMNSKTEEAKHHSNIKHFNLNLHEAESVRVKDSNDITCSPHERTNPPKMKKNKNKILVLGKAESPLLEQSKLGKPSPDKKSKGGNPTTSIKYKYNSYEKAIKSAKMESISGVIHLLVIIMCIVIIVLMTKVNHDWQLLRRRCPLYVKGVASINVYWGNEKNAACNYGAFMPVLILIMSLTLIIFHGGILCSWRHGGDTSKILLSRTYPKIMFFIELFELALLLSVASVLTDGFRQTCVGFQMNPWPEYRPMNCKEGFKNRDEAYGISHTYSRIFGSIIVAWIATIFLLSSVVSFLMRANFRKKREH